MKRLYAFYPLILLIFVMCGTIDIHAQGGTVGFFIDGRFRTTVAFATNDITIPFDNNSLCGFPTTWSGTFVTGSTAPQRFQVEAFLRIDGQTIASRFVDAAIVSTATLTFPIAPIPMLEGTYTVRYRYRPRVCFSAGIFGDICFWGSWQTVDSRAMIISNTNVDLMPVSGPDNVCNDDFSSGDFDVTACRHNEVEIQITPPLGAPQSVVYSATPQLNTGISTFNYRQAANDMGLTLVPGTLYQVRVCARVRAGGILLDQDCENRSFNYNCCTGLPSSGFNVGVLGDRCAGKSFNLFVQNPQADVSYSFSTNVPDMVITQLSNTSASVSTNVFSTPVGPAAITAIATNCAGFQNRLVFVDILDPNSNQCSTFERLAEDKLQVNPLVSPNPMNGKAVLRFDLPEANQVECALLNGVGQVVAKPLAGQKLHAGPQEITIRREQLSSGLYFYQLRVGDEVFTGKILME
ncbi:MAG: T9SS type A sorting domain-containing protein [Bacteroidota bacterium]